ncbi:Uncharacterised protein [Yersinia aldovae]|uniref:Uncharacterized protein n=1 Tax=Yersinia aldovae TaxID=29483 RepID=A0A0T9UXM7_YERAL|nr:Uncharacterised protein [Yersinia aldovae]
MAQVTLPTYDAGYMVANRIESVLVTPGVSIYGQQKLATALEFFQNNRSDSFGVRPPLY